MAVVCACLPTVRPLLTSKRAKIQTFKINFKSLDDLKPSIDLLLRPIFKASRTRDQEDKSVAGFEMLVRDIVPLQIEREQSQIDKSKTSCS